MNKVIMKDEYEQSDNEETTNMMKNTSTNLNSL